MEIPIYEWKDRLSLPMKVGTLQTTGYAYFAVGCGYKVYTWPFGTVGGLAPKDHAFGADFPTGFEGVWVSPTQSTGVLVSGKPNH